MQIDESRWLALRDALRDAEDEAPQYIAIQEAHSALTRARLDRDRHRERESAPLGYADQHMTRERIEQAYATDLAELERRIAERERELARLNARFKAVAAKRATLSRIVEACRAFAAQQGIALPGDDAIRPPAAFASTSVRVSEPPPDTPTFVQGSVRHGGTGAGNEPPPSRAYRVGQGVARMMGLLP